MTFLLYKHHNILIHNMPFRFIVVLPEHIINEESDEGSDNASLNSEDDESDYSENSDVVQIPKGSLQGCIYKLSFGVLFLNLFYVRHRYGWFR